MDQTEEIWSVDKCAQTRILFTYMDLCISGRSVSPSFSTLVRQLSFVHENPTFLLMTSSGLGTGGTATLISLVIIDYVREDVFSKLRTP